MKLNQKIAITTAGVALGFTTMKANPAYAVVRTVDFTIDDVTQSAAYGGAPLLIEQPLSGFYSFDDESTPITVPPASLNLSVFPLVDFNFDFLGRQFSVEDISGYGGTATDLLIGGSIVEGNNVETNFSIFSISRPGFAEPRFNGTAIRGPFVYFIEGRPQLSLRTQRVPEPATVGSLALLGLCSLLLKKKVASECSQKD
ncbi:PEP-CTERM sorting domain-containing protein [Tolypothrix bouteillei VB521301_2]|uniref:PEP-CTERM sorting domain-containing protein n=1 Tax=Tolypothrix bouteillei VB521301 TaxID=1479485 RepID=A0A0C1RDY9_9CYAN|nr:PEP-CTERM sorting domain-containing protein [Tolypothrix bouteillei]KAF3884070.1 PEP-CTERM sorting domain-containing protein [Tolypothrix bouteillei VB521301]